ncbi:uncharacterized protein LOC108003973 isoform X3 [Apis cerana]|nr:uncharacterized protein LOC108003973 isoform X3 [Apis cerana]
MPCRHNGGTSRCTGGVRRYRYIRVAASRFRGKVASITRWPLIARNIGPPPIRPTDLRRSAFPIRSVPIGIRWTVTIWRTARSVTPLGAVGVAAVLAADPSPPLSSNCTPPKANFTMVRRRMDFLMLVLPSRANSVKTERLTPDNNSTSSRSVTPSSSSHPGTPPNATPLGGPEGPPPPHHLKHMEQMMGRNYSDFMRSLAAKYNNANPNDYFSSPRNGYPPGLDPRFPAFKTAATPFVGLMAPLGAPQPSTVSTTSPLSNKDPKEQKQDSLFGNPVFPPMLDMSSTQALLHMVRTANAAQNAAELETYLKGANKRDTGVTSPLDLSSPGGFAPRKRQRAETRRSGSVSPKPKPTPRPTTPPPVRCPSLCGHMPCGDGQAVNRWTIEDVVNYVSSIDICAEYAQNFREHRIDGAALPLLSEDHLTGPMGMKLGPALKLRALLARKLGACTVCLHCAHCHQTPLPALNAAAAAAAASQQQHQQQPQQQQLPGRRPSSTGN